MERRALITGTLAFFGAPLAARAQPAGKVPRIGFLVGSSPAATHQFVEAFRQGLRELGYVEGQNMAIEWRFAEGRYEQFQGFALELVRLRVDVIVAAITPAALAAREATRTIPVVMVLAPDPVGSGLVASLARPGGNVTGLSLLAVDATAKQLELLKEAFPRVSRVAVLRNPTSPPHALMVNEAERAARLLGVQLEVVDAGGPEEFEKAFSRITRERAGALLVLADAMFFLHRTRLAELIGKNRLPAMYGLDEFADVGGLMAHGAEIRDNYRRAASYVGKILKGARPADLPVEQPVKFRLVVNLKTARALGLAIPPSVLIRADELIE